MSRYGLNLDPDRPVHAHNGGLFVSRGQGQHPDRVIDSWELIFVRSGLLSMSEEDRRFELAPGQTLLLWPGRRHRGTAAYPVDLSFYWVHFQVSARRGGRGRDALFVPQVSLPRRPDRLTELLHRFLDDQQDGRLPPPNANLLVTLMLMEAADDVGRHATTPSAAHALAGRVDAYIAAHAHEPISTATIAAAFNCNADYLGRAYHRASQTTITAAIHHARLRDARQLLLAGDLNIDQVARQCGFTAAGYFRRVFQRHHGMTPNHYRRLYQRRQINWR